MILTSAKLDALPSIRHGFSTRLGGVSSGPYATLNLGLDVDKTENVLENRRRFSVMIGLSDPNALAQTNQVHGTEVLPIIDVKGQPRVADETGGIPKDREADGLITESQLAVGVRTADCAPLLIAALDKRPEVIAVAAIHAGWRGATAGILKRAILRLQALGAARFVVAIGPTISAAHFEVGAEVIEAARKSLDGDPPPTIDGPRKKHLDLVALLKMQLARLGVAPQDIDHVGGCTFENRALLFSHRRDQGRTGRLLSAIRMSGGAA